MKVKVLKPIAEINLKMFKKDENNYNCKMQSTGTGEDCLNLIASYIVDVTKNSNVSYRTYLVHLIDKCNKLSDYLR